MALSLLHGSLSTIDATMGGTSVKCVYASMTYQFSRQATSATTFCSTGWVTEIPGMKQMSGSFVGFASKGVAYSDPMIWFTQAPTALVGTCDTGCTISGNVNVFGDSVGLVAAANSSRGTEFRSTDAITTAWMVA